MWCMMMMVMRGNVGMYPRQGIFITESDNITFHHPAGMCNNV